MFPSTCFYAPSQFVHKKAWEEKSESKKQVEILQKSCYAWLRRESWCIVKSKMQKFNGNMLIVVNKSWSMWIKCPLKLLLHWRDEKLQQTKTSDLHRPIKNSNVPQINTWNTQKCLISLAFSNDAAKQIIILGPVIMFSMQYSDPYSNHMLSYFICSKMKWEKWKFK